MKFEKMVVKSNQEEAIEDLTTEYPYVMHHADLRDITIPWHWHEEVEFDYIVSGETEVLTTNGKYIFGKNQAFFINSNVLCCMHKNPQAETAVMHSHLFHPVFLGGHFRSVFETKYIDPVLQNKSLDILEIRGNNEIQRRILEKLRQASFLQKEGNVEFQTRNIFSDIWLLLLDEISALPKDSHGVNLQNQDRMQSMLSYIHRNYAEKVTLEEIAASACVSTRECLRCFRSTIDKSPVEYLMDYRLETAKKLLRDTNMTITEIGIHTGFSSNAYFGKVFRERCGVTPMEYRKEKQQG
ncbi:MAG: AraC family transcriptional regulator [Eubacteriales bacterium]|nr:AraC family transcriptional regulator [Eubacteriales bacterium]